jgi:hypothetical protein
VLEVVNESSAGRAEQQSQVGGMLVVVTVDVVAVLVVSLVVDGAVPVVTVVLAPVVAVVLVAVVSVVVVCVVVGAVVTVAVVVVAVVSVVLVVGVVVLVVVGTPGHTQPGWHSSNAPPGKLGGQVKLPGGSQPSPASTMPLPHTGPPVVVVVDVLIVTVVGGCVCVVVVLAPGQPPPGPQASQQVGWSLTQALPPIGARQESAFRLTLQRVFPLAKVRQQATNPSFPQADRTAQSTTWSRQADERSPFLTAALATRIAQPT